MEASGPDQITLWAHDVTARPGATYRYRVVVTLLNPLFNRDSQLNDEQREAYADRLGLESQTSDWIEVAVPPARRFFLVSASPRPVPSVFVL